MITPWTSDQFFEYLEGLTDDFTAKQIRETITERGLSLACAPSAPQPAPDAVFKALRGLLDHVDRETCVHEETHRGGAIWTICDCCGRKWADDEGGFKPHCDAPAVAAARAAVHQSAATSETAALKALRLVAQHGSVMARLEPDAHDAVIAVLTAAPTPSPTSLAKALADDSVLADQMAKFRPSPDANAVREALLLCVDLLGRVKKVYEVESSPAIDLAVEIARAALASSAPAERWRDISTAPKDGEEIDLWCKNVADGGEARFPEMFWDDGGWENWLSYRLEPKWKPTHWKHKDAGPHTRQQRVTP